MQGKENKYEILCRVYSNGIFINSPNNELLIAGGH